MLCCCCILKLYIFDLMFKNNIRLLIFGCAFIVCIFCLIQYLLISKTYRLEKEKYITDIRQSIAEHLRGQVENLHIKAVSSVFNIITQQTAFKKDILAAIRTQIENDNKRLQSPLRQAIDKVPGLNDAHYSLTYPQIILWQGNKADTLVSERKDLPVEVAGNHIPEQNRLVISTGLQSSSINRVGVDGKSRSYTLEISIAQSVDISNWQTQAFKRLSLYYLSAVGLIILIVLVLYGIIASLLKQKKIADVKTDFANNITHELKTPLSTAGIIIKTLSIIDPIKDTEMFQQQLLSLEKQHGKITRIVDWVLDSAMTSTLPVIVEDIHILSLLHDIKCNQVVHAGQLSINCKDDERILSDKRLLTSIIGNLLDNAIKYSEEGKAILIKYYQVNETCIFEVEDQGTTIPTSFRSYLFDKFYRIPEMDKHSKAGLGLGLYLSKKNAAALGGRISYHPPAHGGNCFQLAIPKYEA
jgi:signal transduction histidine kinase